MIYHSSSSLVITCNHSSSLLALILVAGEVQIRCDAANAAWAAHLDTCRTKLRHRDEQLLHAEDAAFWRAVGVTDQQQLSARSSDELVLADWSRKGLSPHLVDVGATLLRTHPKLAAVKTLILSGM